MSNKNWFGLPQHPTDEVIYWNNTEKEAKEIAAELRPCYDKIVAAGFRDDLDKITAAFYSSGCDDTHDNFSEDL